MRQVEGQPNILKRIVSRMWIWVETHWMAQMESNGYKWVIGIFKIWSTLLLTFQLPLWTFRSRSSWAGIIASSGPSGTQNKIRLASTKCWGRLSGSGCQLVGLSPSLPLALSPHIRSVYARQVPVVPFAHRPKMNTKKKQLQPRHQLPRM